MECGREHRRSQVRGQKCFDLSVFLRGGISRYVVMQLPERESAQGLAQRKLHSFIMIHRASSFDEGGNLLL